MICAQPNTFGLLMCLFSFILRVKEIIIVKIVFNKQRNTYGGNSSCLWVVTVCCHSQASYKINRKMDNLVMHVQFVSPWCIYYCDNRQYGVLVKKITFLFKCFLVTGNYYYLILSIFIHMWYLSSGHLVLSRHLLLYQSNVWNSPLIIEFTYFAI
jgi:hypothetical protein